VWVSDTGRPALVFEPAVEVEPAYRLLLACGAAMHDRDGIATWLQLPPERVEQRVADGELFAAGPLETPVAVFALSPTAPAFYDLSLFRGDEPAHYLSLVAVDPRAWGQGVGRACVDAAEAQATADGARSLRLDTAGENWRAQAFFAALGYVQRSTPLADGRFTYAPFEKEFGAAQPR
jgi:ribosomal protein S18 acetylase RimI-like enzyme